MASCCNYSTSSHWLNIVIISVTWATVACKCSRCMASITLIRGSSWTCSTLIITFYIIVLNYFNKSKIPLYNLINIRMHSQIINNHSMCHKQCTLCWMCMWDIQYYILQLWYMMEITNRDLFCMFHNFD